jgi:hypothetical protein
MHPRLLPCRTGLVSSGKFVRSFTATAHAENENLSIDVAYYTIKCSSATVTAAAAVAQSPGSSCSWLTAPLAVAGHAAAEDSHISSPNTDEALQRIRTTLEPLTAQQLHGIKAPTHPPICSLGICLQTAAKGAVSMLNMLTLHHV